MLLFLKLVFESIRFAISALRENLLRTILSLLGVTVGIFSIISVLTVVDTLNTSIQRSLSFLGDKVVYVQKWPWGFGGGEYQWWKYMKRPQPTLNEFKFLKERLTWAEAVSVFDVRGGLTAKYQSNSLGSVNAMGITYEHNRIAELDIAQGRYFTPQEAERGANVAIIGHTIAQEVFKGADPVGKTMKLGGFKFMIIGVFARQGENLFPTPSNDDVCMMPYPSLAKMFASSSRGLNPNICLKGRPDDPNLTELEGEARGLMRAQRRLKPKQEDNFALNRSDAAAEFIQTVIGVLKVAGWCIGSFAILVGGFGIANIMFVSVKERTNLIGIQKSLGAKNYFILLQFLFEAIFLSLIGGMAGLGLVSLLSFLSTDTFIIILTPANILIGLGVSSVIGVLSGIIPAIIASRLDPVVAIRSA